MITRISLLSAAALIAVIAAPAISHSEYENGDKAIVHDIRNNPIKDIRGNCVRTKWEGTGEECGVEVDKAHVKLASVYFDFNKSTLTPKGKATLNKLLATIKDKKIHEVVIAGYADSIGSDSYNLRLSDKRAHTVKAYLKAHGFKHANTEVRALGKKDAETGAKCKGLKDGALHACMQEDRRVDIELSVSKK